MYPYKLTDWFSCDTGVKQGYFLPPTLFAIFSNDLVKEINDLELGISMGNANVSILMYVDDIVLSSDNEINLQHMLNTLHDWLNVGEWWLPTTNKRKRYTFGGVEHLEQITFSELANCEALAKHIYFICIVIKLYLVIYYMVNSSKKNRWLIGPMNRLLIFVIYVHVSIIKYLLTYSSATVKIIFW